MQKTMDKSILLNELDEVFQKDDNVSIALVFGLSLVLLIVLALFMPRIYLINSIYKTSIQIDALTKQYESLKDENQILADKIAILKYKNGVNH